MQHSAQSYHRRQHWSGLNWFYSQVNGGLSQEKTPALLIKLDGNTYDTAPCRRQMDRWWNLRDTWQKVWQGFWKTPPHFSPCFWSRNNAAGSNSTLPGLDLGWQWRELCLLAPPLKRQTFVSVAGMSKMSSQHVGNILLCRRIFCLLASCR